MTAPTLLSDVALLHAIAGGDVPLTDPDPRLADLYRDGVIEPGADRWRIVLRRVPVQLTPGQREFIADDAAYARRLDV